MASTESSANGYGDIPWLRAEGREPGARRKKLGGYLKAANELRQSYFNPDGSRLGSRDLSDDSGVEGPGSFPDAAIIRGEHEEMMLFPSYARKHVKRKTAPPPMSGDMSEQEYWRREWNRHQDDKAIVDVDVRGWIYSPHRGPATRKHRLMLGVVRQLAGLPAAPASNSTDLGHLGQASSTASNPAPIWKQDEEIIAREAEHIAKKGQKEERYARRGAFSEAAHRDTDADSLYSNTSPASSRGGSPDRGQHRLSEISIASSYDGDAETPRPLQKHPSWVDPAQMTSAQLATANTHLFNRLRPFMANPTPNATITAFFYNNSMSRQHTVYTNPAGHFTCRAALDFIPTHVRVLASEKLSATEEVHVTSPTGVSLISDIDDTIKHSGISVNAREIFRNTFIRELDDLTVEGVREWYNTLHDMGVSMHYVSNSPWQLYPVLTTYFKLAHLPKGSFHLKQYSGMLQGIFEPVAERKKSNLEKIMWDFPDRKFVLVGDSGEADLEVYTDIAIENPGRVLGIFIRDVTTPVKTGYFDPSNGMPGSGKPGRSSSLRKSADSAALSKAALRRGAIHDEQAADSAAVSKEVIRRGAIHDEQAADSAATLKEVLRRDAIHDEEADLKAAIAASLADVEADSTGERQPIVRDSVAPGSIRTPRPILPPRSFTPRSASEPSGISQPEEDLIDLSDEQVPNQPWLPPVDREVTPLAKANGATSPKPSPAPPPKPTKLRSPSPGGHLHASNIEGHNKPPPPPRPRKPSTSVHAPGLPPAQKIPTVPSKPPVSTVPQPSPLSQMTLRSPELKPRPALPTRPKVYGALTSSAAGAQNPVPPATYWNPNFGAGPPRSATPGPSPASPRPISTLSSRSMENMKQPSPDTKRPVPPPPLRSRNATWNTSSTASRPVPNRTSSAWRDAGDEGLPATPAEAGVPKKEFLWSQRWARAKRVLDRNGIMLRTWREGSDVADVCVRLVERAMKEMESDNKPGTGGLG